MKFKALLTAAVTAGMLALSAPASATLTNWYVDTDGAGGNAPVLVRDYLDLTGISYVNNTFNGGSGTTFDFKEVGRFSALTADGGTFNGGSNLNPNLNTYFTANGNGTTGGLLNFIAGTLNVFSGATNIANFDLMSGSANLAANSTLPNGTVSLIFKATSMVNGYFFDQNMNDLAPIANSFDGLIFGFATTNAISGTSQVPVELISDYNAAFNPDITGPIFGDGRNNLYLSNNGQFRMEVPEPGMLSLFGIAFLGMGFLGRRRKSS